MPKSNRNVLSLIATWRTSSYAMQQRCEARSLRVRLEMMKSELEELRLICGHGPGSMVDLWCVAVGLWWTLNMGLVNLGLGFSLNLEILAKIYGIYFIFLDWWHNITVIESQIEGQNLETMWSLLIWNCWTRLVFNYQEITKKELEWNSFHSN